MGTANNPYLPCRISNCWLPGDQGSEPPRARLIHHYVAGGSQPHFPYAARIPVAGADSAGQSRRSNNVTHVRHVPRDCMFPWTAYWRLGRLSAGQPLICLSNARGPRPSTCIAPDMQLDKFSTNFSCNQFIAQKSVKMCKGCQTEQDLSPHCHDGTLFFEKNQLLFLRHLGPQSPPDILARPLLHSPSLKMTKSVIMQYNPGVVYRFSRISPERLKIEPCKFQDVCGRVLGTRTPIFVEISS